MHKLLSILFYLLFALPCMSQNIGIGTINPLNPLHVSTNGSNVLLIENTQLLNTDTTTGLFFKTGNGTYPYTGAIKTIGQNTYESRLGLFTHASGTSSELIERLSVLDNGNVGIGTRSPGAKLELAGGVKISDSINIGGQMRIMSGIPGAGKVLTSDATGLASWQPCTPAGTAPGQMNYWNGTAWVNVEPGEYAQSLVFCDGVPTWGSCVPKVTTNSTAFSFYNATCGGNVTTEGGGGASVTARGVCWSTSANPTVSLTTKTVNGSGIGSFVSNISGLIAGTTYYLRAYATNTAGTSYGTQDSFTTLATVTIGTQVWSSKNLDVQTYRNGDTIPEVTDPTAWSNLTTGAWCWYENNNGAMFGTKFGRLYNGYAVNDPRGLAPAGMHIPTEAEWNKLIKFIDVGADTICTSCVQSTTAGGAMKSTAVLAFPNNGWFSPNTGATNSSGFAGLPGGICSSSGLFGYGFGSGYWWSAGGLSLRYLIYNNSNVYRYSSSRREGFSVRVVRD